MWEQKVGERIGQLRRERNLSRAAFGELIGLSGQHVGRIERGTHKITGMTIAKICDKTGVSADYIMFGSIDPIAAVTSLYGLSEAQIQVFLEIAISVVKFLKTQNGNNVLIKEVLRRQKITIA